MQPAKIYISKFESFLEQMNKQKDEALFVFIKKYWPRYITPNHLTIIRIFIGAALFILLFNFKNDNGALIMPLFFIGALTDFLDGPIARGLNMKTKLGEALDPAADRILLVPIAVYTIIDYQFLLFFLIFLEIINALISAFTYGKNIFFGSNIFGKTKMFLQSLVFAAILVFWPDTPHLFFLGLLWISVGLMAISIFFKIAQVRLHYETQHI